MHELTHISLHGVKVGDGCPEENDGLFVDKVVFFDVDVVVCFFMVVVVVVVVDGAM